MTQTSTGHKCPYSRHSGPVGCLPAPNIFPLAKETLAKGKMFWNELEIFNDAVKPLPKMSLFSPLGSRRVPASA